MKCLEFSRALTISCLRKRAEVCSLHVNTDVFNTVHRKRHRFLALFECFLSKTYRNEYRMNKDGHTSSDIDACWLVLTINHVPVQRPNTYMHKLLVIIILMDREAWWSIWTCRTRHVIWEWWPTFRWWVVPTNNPWEYIIWAIGQRENNKNTIWHWGIPIHYVITYFGRLRFYLIKRIVLWLLVLGCSWRWPYGCYSDMRIKVLWEWSIC